MIKALRRKFILTTMALLFTVFGIMLTVLNLTARANRENAAFSDMYSLSAAARVPRFKLRDEPAEADPRLRTDAPPDPAPGAGHSRRSSWTDDMAFKEMYAVITDKSGTVIEKFMMFDFPLGEEQLTAMAQSALGNGRDRGRTGSYLYLKAQRSEGTMIVFRNYEEGIAADRQMLISSVLIGLAALTVLFAVTFALSRTVTGPADRAFKQQKQFIADASHELKTPLSTIAINAEVLKGDIGQNRFLENIISECGQMEELVLSLLTLAKLDAGDRKPAVMQKTDLSVLCSEAVLSYESIAYEKKVEFISEIGENITLRGNGPELKKLIGILLDNAFKYVSVPGNVTVRLKTEEQKAVLTVSDTGEDIREEALAHLFERFYRADDSRTGEKSFGLGLAIADEIVRRHGGKIGVTSSGGKTEFTIVL